MITDKPLYVIFRDGYNVCIRKVAIIDEDDKVYKIAFPEANVTILGKVFINTYVNGLVFGFEKEQLIKAWNEYINNNIKRLEEDLNTEKGYIVTRDLSNLVMIDELL